MRTRTTILLALALVVASAFAWYDTPVGNAPFHAASDAEAPPLQAPGDQIIRLLDFTASSVERITLERGAFKVVLARNGNAWTGMDRSEPIDDFLRGMADMAQIIVVGADQGGPADFGLDPPVARIVLERSDAPAIDLRLGNPNPTSTGVYAQVGTQGPVVLTGALALWDVDKLVRLVQGKDTPAADD